MPILPTCSCFSCFSSDLGCLASRVREHHMPWFGNIIIWSLQPLLVIKLPRANLQLPALSDRPRGSACRPLGTHLQPPCQQFSTKGWQGTRVVTSESTPSIVPTRTRELYRHGGSCLASACCLCPEAIGWETSASALCLFEGLDIV